MAGSRGTVRHLCRDKNGRPVKRPRLQDGTAAKHAPDCRQRDRGWAYGIRLTPDRYLRRGGFTSEQAASEAMEAVRKQFSIGIDPTVKPPTMDEWLSDWLALRRYTKRRQPVRPQSHAVLRRQVDRYLRPCLGHLRLDSLRVAHVEGMFDGIRAANRHAERVVGLATQNAVLTALRSALDEAVRQGKLVRNPLGNFGLEPYVPPRPDPWTVEERDAFLDRARADEEPLLPAFELILFYALRAGEVLGLRWQDVDLKTGKVHICHQVGGGPPKSRAGDRVFVLDDDALALVREHRKRQLQERLLAESAWQDNDLVFARADGSPLTHKQLERAWKRTIQRAALRPISIHGGRHTAVTQAIMHSEVPPKTVSEMAGHANVGFTLTYYAHVLDEHRVAAAKMIGSSRARRSEVGT
jgi:integrase